MLTGDLAHNTEKALAYFKTNAHRIRYAYFRDHGMFVGSGAVEAFCKAVIGQRLKLSTMRWNIPGTTGFLTLRCQHASGRCSSSHGGRRGSSDPPTRAHEAYRSIGQHPPPAANTVWAAAEQDSLLLTNQER